MSERIRHSIELLSWEINPRPVDKTHIDCCIAESSTDNLVQLLFKRLSEWFFTGIFIIW